MNNSLESFYHELAIETARMQEVIFRHAEDYHKVVELLKASVRECKWNGCYADIGFKTGQVQGIIVQIHLGKTESFKAIAGIITACTDLEFAVRSQMDNVEWGYREIVLAKPNPEPTKDPDTRYILLTIRIWPPSDSEVCKRVECGFTPMYKLECAGDP